MGSCQGQAIKPRFQNPSCHSFIHLYSKHWLSTEYKPGIMLGSRDTAVSNKGGVPDFTELTVHGRGARPGTQDYKHVSVWRRRIINRGTYVSLGVAKEGILKVISFNMNPEYEEAVFWITSVGDSIIAKENKTWDSSEVRDHGSSRDHRLESAAGFLKVQGEWPGSWSYHIGSYRPRRRVCILSWPWRAIGRL